MDIFWLNDGINRWEGGKAVDPSRNKLKEAIIGDNNFVDVAWLERAISATKKVAKIGRPGAGTGFMISEDILLTNEHVFPNEQKAQKSKLQFNFDTGIDGKYKDIDYWETDPSSLFHCNKKLDYAIVKVKPNGAGQKAGEVWGFFDISIKPDIQVNARANIIQHPGGDCKKIAFRDNQIRKVGSDYLQYVTDTFGGSSGSPVMDDDFNVIALHKEAHGRIEGSIKRWYYNQGSLISTIYEEIEGFLKD